MTVTYSSWGVMQRPALIGKLFPSKCTVVNFLGGLRVLVCRCVFLCHVQSLSILLVAEDERSESREGCVFGLSVSERVLTKHHTSRADGGDCCISRPDGALPLIQQQLRDHRGHARRGYMSICMSQVDVQPLRIKRSH